MIPLDPETIKKMAEIVTAVNDGRYVSYLSKANTTSAVQKDTLAGVDIEELLIEADLRPVNENDNAEEPDSIDIDLLENELRAFAESKFKFHGKSLDRLDRLELQALVGMLLRVNRSPKEISSDILKNLDKETERSKRLKVIDDFAKQWNSTNN